MSTSGISNGLSSPKDKAIRILCSKHLHRVLWLPETADHPKLRVTYATTSNFDDASLPIILFIGPMFGSRWTALYFDKLARDCRVRLICPDRPARGGATPVDINIRIRVWLETVPALLDALNVKHVSLVTHSAGTIYTLNTLLQHRSLLDPRTPLVAFLAPYVPTTASNATLTSLLSKLPTGIIDSWAGLATFINTKIIPGAEWSGGLLSSATSIFPSSASEESDGSTSLAERYGVDEETAKEIDKLFIKYRFAEDVSGVNEEAKLCLRKCDAGAWGHATDYVACIRSIAEAEHILQSQNPGGAKLKVDASFASSDVMSGKQGQEYFEQCWQQNEFKESVEFATMTCPDTDHDSVLDDYNKGALRRVFEKVASTDR